MVLRGKPDAASTHVLEAMIVASVMLGSIAFVVTYDIPPGETDAAREALTTRMRDVLAIMNDTPVEGSPLGDNVLSVSLLECLQRDCDRLETKLRQLLPVGTQYAVYLSTGDGLYPIYAPREPAGEAITQRRLIEPAWSYLFLATSQSMVNPLEDPLVVYGIPVVSANPVHQGGSTLSILAYGTRASDNAAVVMRASATTRAVTAADVPAQPGVSMWFHEGDGVPQGAMDVHATTVDVAGNPTGTPVLFGLRVQVDGGSVPSGTIASIQLPHGWKATAPQDLNDDDWLVLSNATDANGTSRASSVTAKLTHDVSDGAVDLWFRGTYVGDADDYYAFTASLTAGAYAKASALVRGDDHLVLPSFEVPQLVASVPRPLGVGATTTWTLAGLSSDEVEIERIEIREEEGREIFDTAAPVVGGGAWSTTGDALVWEGSATLDQDNPLELVFDVTASAVRGPPVDRAPFVPSVEISDFSGALALETSPGLHVGVFLPATASAKGYDTTITGLQTDHDIESDAVYRSTPLPGSATYTVGPALGLGDSGFGATIALDDRYVTPGSTLAMTIETQSVMYHLAALGFEPTVELNVYPPWTGDDRTPITNQTLYNATVAKGAGTFLELLDLDGDLQLDETAVGRIDTTLAVPHHWLYGSYIVEAKITWLDDVGADDVLHSVNLYDYFVVRPTNGDLPSSPVYDVHLLAWQGEWG